MNVEFKNIIHFADDDGCGGDDDDNENRHTLVIGQIGMFRLSCWLICVRYFVYIFLFLDHLLTVGITKNYCEIKCVTKIKQTDQTKLNRTIKKCYVLGKSFASREKYIKFRFVYLKDQVLVFTY